MIQKKMICNELIFIDAPIIYKKIVFFEEFVCVLLLYDF